MVEFRVFGYFTGLFFGAMLVAGSLYHPSHVPIQVAIGMGIVCATISFAVVYH